MIEILGLNALKTRYFKNYNEFFECLTLTENLKLIEKCPDFTQMNWSFTTYSPKRVVDLYAHSIDPAPAIIEAFESNSSLIEICKGDYKKPLYIVITPTIDLVTVKKKWCLDYCAAHYFLIRENVEVTEELSRMDGSGASCIL